MAKANFLGGSGYHEISPFDRLKKYILPSYPVVQIDKTPTIDQLLSISSEYRNQQPMVWIHIASNKVRDDFPWHYRPDGIDKSYIHRFYQTDPTTGDYIRTPSLFLVPTGTEVIDYLDNKIPLGVQTITYEMFMISYKHFRNNDNIYYMKNMRYPNIILIDDVETKQEAYKRIAEISVTPMVYIMDDNTTAMDHFNFDFVPARLRHKDTAYIWKTQSVVNSIDTYTNGIRLLPQHIVSKLSKDDTGIVENNIRYKKLETMSYHKSSANPIIAWATAFYAVAMLALDSNDAEIENWITQGKHAKHGRFSIQGAKAAIKFVELNKGNISAYGKLNDIRYMKQLMREFK